MVSAPWSSSYKPHSLSLALSLSVFQGSRHLKSKPAQREGASYMAHLSYDHTFQLKVPDPTEHLAPFSQCAVCGERAAGATLPMSGAQWPPPHISCLSFSPSRVGHNSRPVTVPSCVGSRVPVLDHLGPSPLSDFVLTAHGCGLLSAGPWLRILGAPVFPQHLDHQEVGLLLFFSISCSLELPRLAGKRSSLSTAPSPAPLASSLTWGPALPCSVSQGL